MKVYFNSIILKEDLVYKKILYKSTPSQSTNVASVISKWQKSIKANNSIGLEFDSICIYGRTEQYITGDSTQWIKEHGYKQPLLEYLYYNYQDAFIKLAQLVSDCTDENIKAAFISAIINTDLYQKGLFSWNNAIKCNLIASIEKLRNYVESLKHTRKELHAKELAAELLEKVNEGPSLNPGEKTLF